MTGQLASRLTLLIVASIVFSCTAREPLAPVSTADFQPFADESLLWEESERMHSIFSRAGVLYDDPALTEYLDGIAGDLLPALGSPDGRVRVHVLRDPFLNAFALPNGTVYLHMGLLARMENEAQLATVLGHELTHFVRRHSLQEHRHSESRQKRARLVADVLAVAFAALAGNPGVATMFLDLTDPLVENVVRLQVDGYSRDMEREADERGFHALVAAGYDPRQGPAVFRALQVEHREAGIPEPYFFGSHPALSERIESYEKKVRAWEARDPSSLRVGAVDFSDHVAGLRLENARQEMSLGRFRRARYSIRAHLEHDPASADAHFLLGELYQLEGSGEGHLAAAVSAYRAAIERDEEHAAAYRELGAAYWRMGQTAAAQYTYRRYLEVAPDSVDRSIIEGYLAELSNGASAP